jgi:hypothetical protein
MCSLSHCTETVVVYRVPAWQQVYTPQYHKLVSYHHLFSQPLWYFWQPHYSLWLLNLTHISATSAFMIAILIAQQCEECYEEH